jgi:hypothetical protein
MVTIDQQRLPRRHEGESERVSMVTIDQQRLPRRQKGESERVSPMHCKMELAWTRIPVKEATSTSSQE